MVYRLLEDRSKKGAGRSMRALAWRVCAWVLPLYRNLEPITRKPLGGGSGDTSLEQSNGDEEWGSGLHGQTQNQTAAGFSFQRPTNGNTSQSRKGDLGKGGVFFPTPLNLTGSYSPHPSQGSLPEEGVVLNADLPQPLG